MADTKGGFPFWEVRFDESGNVVNDGADLLIKEIAAKNLTDLFIFSHGWNNSPAFALSLNDRIFGQMRDVIDDPRFDGKKKRDFAIGAVGVIWPSMKWLDDGADDSDAVAAASAGGVDTSDRALILDLKSIYTRPEQQAAVDRMAELIDERSEDDEKLEEFRTLLTKLLKEADGAAPPAVRDEDDLAAVMFQKERPAREVFETIAREAAGPEADADQGGAADFGGAAGFNPFRKIWDGAKEAARQATYWTMKRRAGVVGRKGLGPLIDRVHGAAKDVKIHLMGHSFGARLVSFSLTGVTADPTPVKSLTMLQGAFSHFAFTERLPFDPGRSGALAGWQRRVDGPILITHTKLDQAVGTFYPLAALAGLDDASAAGELTDRWQGMGYDGAREVDAAPLDLGLAFATAYPFKPGSFYNLDANHVITKGKFPSGAHGDIVHPHVAWATLAAAGIV